ncbi:MAG: ATP-binding protein [bacterium]|nr:ATP-binding protein [bacterium]
MIIKRKITDLLNTTLSGEKKVVILYGPRQSGKTTLIKELMGLNKISENQMFTGDDIFAQNLFGKNDLLALQKVVGENKFLVIDEAQRIDNIGLTLKLLIDNFPIMLLVSGSASFDLAEKINEPLTGRTKTFYLYPFSYDEIADRYTRSSPEATMEDILRFGMYPKTTTLVGDSDKEDYLYEYLNNYLYKDILTFGQIKKPAKVMDLLVLLALQIGKEVSIAELAQNLALNQKTVGNYLDVLEKMFIIFNLRGFSRNLRKEIAKTSKYYFYDVGLRNAVIRNFNHLNLRQDTEELFENWFISEKIKLAANTRQPANFYFWRTYDQKEIDLIEERGGSLIGYGCKFSADRSVSAPKDFVSAYDKAEFKVVNKGNFSEFLLNK